MGLYADTDICVISQADNGFIVKLVDVDPPAEKKKEPKEGPGLVQDDDPEVIVCKSLGDLIALLTDKLPKIVSDSTEYGDAFKEAAKSPTAKSKY